MSFVKTILCPVDFSPGSERAAEQAALLAKATGASIELLHVYQIPMVVLPEGVVTTDAEFVTKLTDHAQRQLDTLRDKLLAHGVSVSTRLIQGEPVPTILARAKEMAASLMVLGTHGHGGFKRLILGSTTERVVRQSPIPVLSVHLAQ